MNFVKRQYDPMLLELIRVLGQVSGIGFLLCLAALLHGQSAFSAEQLVLYIVWFAVSILSSYVMRKGDVWGAYALLIVTVLVALHDILSGLARWEAAILSVLVFGIIAEYLISAHEPRESERQQVEAH